MTAMLKKEMSSIIKDGRFRVLALIILLLSASLLFVATQKYSANEQERQAIDQALRKQWEFQGDKNPHRGAHFGQYVLRPDNPISILEPGLTAVSGQALYIEPHIRNVTRFSPAADETIASRFAQLSPMLLLYALLPLMLIAITFNSVSLEREQGTLRMMHALGVSSGRLLLAKLLASQFAIWMVLLPVGIVVGVLLSCLPGNHAGMWPRLGITAVSYFAYLWIFGSLCVGASALFKRSRTSLIFMLLFWLVMVMTMPRVGTSIAAQLVQTPSAEEFWSDIKTDTDEGLPGDGNQTERMKRFDASLLKKYDVKSLDDLPLGVNALRRLERDGYGERVQDVHFAALWEKYRQQKSLALLGSGFSPAVAIKNIAMAMAGTDLDTQHHFESAAEKYRREVNTLIDQWDIANSQGITSFDAKYAGNNVWQSVPKMKYIPPSLAQSIQNLLIDFSTVAAWLVAATLFLMYAARRLKP
ncbi:DUF3526 domain-containing protein [Herbaspirillum seropedicae]|nr:DUF3526 domain-containing protein [Herbaspirillum sp. alder98]